jgi:hypothetical protein
MFLRGAVAVSVITAVAIAQPENPLLEKPTDPREMLTLQSIPKLDLPAPTPLTSDECKHIRALIDELASIESPNYGLSSTLWGSSFAPVPQLDRFEGGVIQIDHKLQTPSAFLELVKLGPKAIPFLLDAVSDVRPTKLAFGRQGIIMSMWYADEMGGNPMNAAERDAFGRVPAKGEERTPGQIVDEHQVTVGDVCFVILGQITGRGYAAVRYQPSGCQVFNSPTHSPQIAERVRLIWSDPDPARRLFDSLLMDFSTRGKHAGDSLDQWYFGAGFAPVAAPRLLYYFPDQAAPLIARCLDSLDVSDVAANGLEEFVKQCVANGVRADDLIGAIAWSDRPEIRAALRRLMDRTNDPSVYLKCIDADQSTERVTGRLRQFLRELPSEDPGPFGRGYHLLIALGRRNADQARTEFERFAAGNLHQRRAVAHAVGEVKPAWGCAVLLPLLDDRQSADWWTYAVNPGSNEPRLPIRVCDEAAASITLIRPEFGFEMKGSHEGLDAAIDRIKRALIHVESPELSVPPRE